GHVGGRGRRGGLRRGGGGVEELGGGTVDGEEQRGGRAHTGAVRPREGCRRRAERDREAHARGVLERVEGDPEGGRVGQRLDAQLDEVGRVVAVDGVGRVGVGAGD